MLEVQDILLSPADVVLCAPAADAVHYGLERLPARSRRRKLLTRELRLVRSAVRWVDWTEPAALLFGQIKAALVRRGERIVAIAAIARHLGAEVATCNVRDFQRVHELVVQDWSPAAR